jgi:hypothetical protein
LSRESEWEVAAVSWEDLHISFPFDIHVIFGYFFSIVHGGLNMPAKRTALFLASVFALLAAIVPKPSAALTRTVVSNTAQCPSDTVNFPCYTSLTDAINAVLSGEAIVIGPGTYTGNFVINQNISSIAGRETGATFISGGGSGAALTIKGVAGNISIKRLSFVNAATGILVQNSPSVTITSNIFQVGSSSTAIQLMSSSNAIISNNSFFQNQNGILSDAPIVNIKNNIFSSQLTTAMSAAIDITNILNNLFFNCNSIGPTTISFDPSDIVNYKGNLELQDPRFVTVVPADATQRDFHLLAGSPCINTGSTSVGVDSVDNSLPDMGTYGGPDADTIPFRVSGVSAVNSATTIDLSWAPNNAYTVAGYRVYYGSSPGVYTGTGATEGASPITVPTGTAVTTFNLSGLASAVTPSAPTLLPLSPVNEGLIVTWTAVPGATGYIIHYGLTTTPTNSVSVGGATTSYTLSGLTNGKDHIYNVYVSAVSQAIYYIAVTAIDNAGEASGVPGSAHESDYSSEITAGSGDVKESPLSNMESDFPEALVAYPNLPNTRQGCFIATAAYGYYSAPQVQALRNFRDRFLLTSGPGRAFVEWYYTHGPAAATWLNEHPQFKPLIRAALLPIIGMALFMTQTSQALKLALMMLLLCILLYAFYRQRLSRAGGLR